MAEQRTDVPAEFVGVREAAARLGIGRGTLYELIQRDKFPVRVVRVGRLLRIHRESLDAFIAGIGEGAVAGGEAAQTAPSPAR